MHNIEMNILGEFIHFSPLSLKIIQTSSTIIFQHR